MSPRPAGPRPVPARITLALDAAGLYGPEVDQALGGEEPMVDDWEAGRYLPTREQVEQLAAMTGFPVAFFYEPPSDLERQPNTTFICRRARRGDNGLTVVSSYIGDDGVLHLQELTPTRPPHRPRSRITSSPRQETPMARRSTATIPRGRPHLTVEDPDTPGVCLHCRRRLDLPNDRHIGAADLPDNPVAETDARRLGEAGQQ